MNSEWTQALLGGVLIGLAAGLLLLMQGRIAGISGILGTLLSSSRERGWRLSFVVSMVLVGLATAHWFPERFRIIGMPRWPVILIAGVLVGVGTRLGGGCTSGHGVCGLGRGSPRSFAATLTFMATAILTVLLTRHLL